jgi:hypothetical protein
VGYPDRIVNRELPLAPQAIAKGFALDIGHGEPQQLCPALRSRRTAVEH